MPLFAFLASSSAFPKHLVLLNHRLRAFSLLFRIPENGEKEIMKKIVGLPAEADAWMDV
jgi:hypothetical protein